METQLPDWTLAELAAHIGGEVVGDPSQRIRRPVPAGFDDPAGITFAESDKYLAKIRSSQVAAAIVPVGAALDIPVIQHPSPRAAFAAVLRLVRVDPPLAPGIHSLAFVHPGAAVDSSASVGPYAFVEDGAEIGPGCRVYPFAFVGTGCRLGSNVVVYPHAVLLANVTVGDNSIIHPGAILGADGFGFAWDGTKHRRIDQVGGTRLEDQVEVGANACIDRATCGETVIEQGTKIDNLVQVGHNCLIKEHSVVAGLTGISGSAVIGKRNVIGGQVAIADHAELADDVVLAGRTGVIGNVSHPGEYFGTPPTPPREAMRILALQRRLPELFQRLKELEEEVARWRDQSNMTD